MIKDISSKELIRMQNRTMPMEKKGRNPVSPVLPTVSENGIFIYCNVVICLDEGIRKV